MRQRRGTVHIIVVAMFGLVLGLGGCGSLGPRTLDRDQINYGNSIGDNWKNQMLANIVKLRFVDMPVFVDVGQIVSGYTLETQVNGSLGFGTTLSGGDSQSLGAAGRYTDRPTITYMPKTGEDYLRSLLEPVKPGSVLTLIAAGYSPELLFTWAVESINGVRNLSRTGSFSQEAPDPRFYEFVRLMSELQRSGAVSFEVKPDADDHHDVLFTFVDRNIDAEKEAKRQRVRELLGLEAGRREFRVVYAPFATKSDELAMQTRSILQMLYAMASFVDVPADKASRAFHGTRLSSGMDRPFTVHTGIERPDDVFASVRYHGDWYWIDHEDLNSKRVFTVTLFMTTLTNRSGTENAPVLTIPTN